jgi:hypothetical protein
MQRARRSSHSASRTGLPHLAPASKKSSRLAPSRVSAALARAGQDLKATAALVGCGRLGRRDVQISTMQLVQVIRGLTDGGSQAWQSPRGTKRELAFLGQLGFDNHRSEQALKADLFVCSGRGVTVRS